MIYDYWSNVKSMTQNIFTQSTADEGLIGLDESIERRCSHVPSCNMACVALIVYCVYAFLSYLVIFGDKSFDHSSVTYVVSS